MDSQPLISYGVVYEANMNISAYCWQDTGHMTASGKSAHTPWGCAAGPEIPFGSQIIVKDGPWKGVYTVDDRGGAITRGHIDLRLKDHDTCIAWGRRTLPVIVRTYTGRAHNEPASRAKEGRSDTQMDAGTTERPSPQPMVYQCPGVLAEIHQEPVSQAKEGRGAIQNGSIIEQAANQAHAQGTPIQSRVLGIHPPEAGAVTWRAVGYKPDMATHGVASSLAHSALLGAILGLAVGGGVIVGIMKGWTLG